MLSSPVDWIPQPRPSWDRWIAHYAYHPGIREATVRVEYIQEPSGVVITFIDRGIPYDPLTVEVPDTTRSAEERTFGGLGSHIVKQSLDAVKYRYEDGRNILEITKWL